MPAPDRGRGQAAAGIQCGGGGAQTEKPGFPLSRERRKEKSTSSRRD
jgi:hypothetical protein